MCIRDSLEVGALNPASGSEAEPQRESNWVHFSIKNLTSDGINSLESTHVLENWYNVTNVNIKIIACQIIGPAAAGSPGPVPTALLCQVADDEACQRLRSITLSLIVSCTRLSTVSDRGFPVAAARVWNGLPEHVTFAPSITVFRFRLRTHLFHISYPTPLWLYSACAVTLVSLWTL